MPDEPLLSIDNLRKTYDGAHYALDGVSLSVGRGSFVSIIGSSGAGKSTLLRCVNRLVEPTSGSVVFEGRDVCGLGRADLRRVRMRIGMVFQNYNLVGRQTALANVLQGRLGDKGAFSGAFGLFTAEEKRAGLEALDQVGLADFAYARADELSGGQKQRVGIARALVQKPVLILADEPVASLDPHSSRTVLELLKRASTDMGVSCLVSLHQVEYAVEFSDRIVGLAHGSVCCAGAPSAFDEQTVAGIYDSYYGEENPADGSAASHAMAQPRCCEG